MSDARLVPFWPVDGLALRTPWLELANLTEADYPEAIDAALAGIHDPGTMPFEVPWTDAPRGELVPNALRYWWSVRGRVAPDDWALLFAVREAGRFLGVQEISARDFAVTREVGTGSWLTRAAQGRGIGTEMRWAVLLFAFDHLGARRATSGAFEDNPSSLGVSRKVGYVENGRDVVARRGLRAQQVRFVVTPEELRRPDWTLDVTGLDAACRAMLGAPGAADTGP